MIDATDLHCQDRYPLARAIRWASADCLMLPPPPELDPRLLFTVGVIILAALCLCGCASVTGPTSPVPDDTVGQPCIDNPICEKLVTGQAKWCVEIAGRYCAVRMAKSDPHIYAAWVNWRDGDPRPIVYWSTAVLDPRYAFWVNDCRMAHEAAHVAGIWDEAQATKRAGEATGENCFAVFDVDFVRTHAVR